MPTNNKFFESKKNRLIVFVCVSLIAVLLGALIFLAIRKNMNSDESTGGSPTTSEEGNEEESEGSEEEIAEDTDGPVEPEGASIPIEDAIANAVNVSETAPFEEAFEAKLDLIGYYRALEDFEAVNSVVASIDPSSLTDRQTYYFAEAAYFAYGDREEDYEKRDYYLAMKTNAANRIYEQEHPELFSGDE